jgi:hypothetical protein
MADAFLTWFGRVWLVAVALVMIVLSIRIPHLDGSAMFRVARFIIVLIPNPFGSWWGCGVMLVLPGIGAFIVRDILRRKNRIA